MGTNDTHLRMEERTKILWGLSRAAHGEQLPVVCRVRRVRSVAN